MHPPSIGSFDPRYIIDVKLLHPENAPNPIVLTKDGIVMDVRFEQLQKAYFPTDVIFDAIFTVFKLIHPLNVYVLIEVTPDGIVIDVIDSHPENAPDPIEVTEDGMVIDVRFLQL